MPLQIPRTSGSAVRQILPFQFRMSKPCNLAKILVHVVVSKSLPNLVYVNPTSEWVNFFIISYTSYF